MSSRNVERISVFRFVMAALAVKILFAFGAIFYFLVTEKELPDISTGTTIAAIGAAFIWYSKSINRPMEIAENILFSSGVAVSDFVLSLTFLAGIIWMSGQPFSVEGADIAIFEGKGFLMQTDSQIAMVISLGFSTITTFAISAFFAWITTRKLTKEEK